MRSLRDQIESKCVHFNGIQSKVCEAGVVYGSFPKGELPCFKDRQCHACEHRRWKTEEEIQQRLDEINSSAERTTTAMVVVIKDLKLRNLGKGHGGLGEVKCPLCESGTIRYSVAGYNGHIHAACSTPKCFGIIQ